MYSLSRLSAISIKLGLNNEGNYFLEESRKFLYPSMTWRTLLFWPLSTQGPNIKNGHWSADIWFPSLPPAEYRWLWKALRSACDINSSFLNNWEPMDLLYNLHTLRVSQSPQEKRLMRGDEVGWFHTCVILFWKPNKEAWLNRINVVRKISVAGQKWERVNVLTLGASPVTGQEKMKRIIRSIILKFLFCWWFWSSTVLCKNINHHINLRNERAIMCDDLKSNSNEGFTKHYFSLLSFRFHLSFRLKCL